MAKAKPQRVNFYGNAADLLCFTMAMAGVGNAGIKTALDSAGLILSDSQIQYRIGLAERSRRKGTDTQRTLFRKGKSPIAQALVAQIMGNRGLGQIVKSTAVQTLEHRRLYEPLKPKGAGIMKDEPPQRARRA